MVAFGILLGLGMAIAVEPPVELPAVALGTAVVYRVEVGAVVFVAIYIAVMSLVLAMHSRGFTEIGGGGVKAQDLAGLSRDEFVIVELLLELADEVGNLRSRMEDVRVR